MIFLLKSIFFSIEELDGTKSKKWVKKGVFFLIFNSRTFPDNMRAKKVFTPGSKPPKDPKSLEKRGRPRKVRASGTPRAHNYRTRLDIDI